MRIIYNKNNLIFLLFLSYLLTFYTNVKAQKIVENQTILWTSYQTTININPTYFFAAETHERFFIHPLSQLQSITHIRFHKIFPQNWDAGIGFAFSLATSNKPYKTPPTPLTIPEIRPYFEANYKQKLTHLQIEHRYRFETRFFHNVLNNTALDNGFHFQNYRARYRLQATLPFWQNAEKKPIMSARISNEIFVNIGKKITYNPFDQNRLYAALIWHATQNLNFETGYANWFQQQSSGNNFYSRNMLRFGIQQKIN